MIKTLRTSLLPLLFLFSPVLLVRAQTISVTVGEVTGSVGETVLIPVTLSGVESTPGFNNFQFRVVSSNANLTYLRLENDETDTLPLQTGWPGGNVSSFANGIVAGFAGSNPPVTTSGVLIKLAFRIENSGDVGIQLTEATFGLTTSGGGNQEISFEPPVPSVGVPPAGTPEPQGDTYNVEEGGTLTVNPAEGVLANDSDPDGDDLVVSLVTDVSHGTLFLQETGSFVYEHDGSEDAQDTFTYSASDGSGSATATVTIQIDGVNEGPEFSSSLDNVDAFIGQDISISFAASDPENDPLTYELLEGPTGSAINENSGLFTWTADAAGDHSVQVQVSDGEFEVESPVITIAVEAAEEFVAVLSGVNHPVPVAGAGAGEVHIFFSDVDNSLSVTGEFESLSSQSAGSYLGIGEFGSDGVVYLELTTTSSSGGTAGSYPQASNAYDLDAIPLPDGLVLQDVLDALEAGNLFVNVLSVDNLSGELRGQFRATGNAAPTTFDLNGPLAMNAEGDPGTHLFDITWSGSVSDPDGDDAKLFFELSDENGQVFRLEDVSSSNEVDFTVAEAAALFDEMTGGVPGSVDLGGTVDVTMRLVATDGSAVAFGTPHEMTLTRGIVTVRRPEPEVPDQFTLRGNYPNPFNPSTTVHFDLPETATVSITVLDMLGRTMITVPEQTFSPGANRSVRVEAGDLASGIYIYRVVARGAESTHVSTGTMTLIK